MPRVLAISFGLESVPGLVEPTYVVVVPGQARSQPIPDDLRAALEANRD